MDHLLQVSVAFPTVVFTVLVCIALVYWVFVILGAFDLDMGGDGDLGGDVGGHGDVGDIGGDVGGDVGDIGGDVGGDVGDMGGDVGGHGDAGDVGGDAGDAGHAHAGAVAVILSALGLRKVPLTISLSFIFLFGWIICLVLVLLVGDGGGLPAWLLGSLLLVGAFLLAVPPAALVARPLAPVFVIHEAKRRSHYVGSTCTVLTGHVDGKFGQARIEDGGDVLVIQVRCDRDGAFSRSDKALIISFDDERQAYLIEPMDAVIGKNDPKSS